MKVNTTQNLKLKMADSESTAALILATLNNNKVPGKTKLFAERCGDPKVFLTPLKGFNCVKPGYVFIFFLFAGKILKRRRNKITYRTKMADKRMSGLTHEQFADLSSVFDTVSEWAIVNCERYLMLGVMLLCCIICLQAD